MKSKIDFEYNNNTMSSINVSYKKYDEQTAAIMKALKTETTDLFNSMDWMNDVNAGEKYEEEFNNIVVGILDSFLSQRKKTTSNYYHLTVIEEAIKNEYPTAYNSCKCKTGKRVVNSIRKWFNFHSQ